MTVIVPTPRVRCVDMDAADAQLVESVRERGETGAVHSWELVTAVDGPGTRVTVFLAGCALRCQYCQNPDTWTMRGGQRHTVDETMDRIGRYRGVMEASGGGVTLSGGEPLLQAPFVEKVFRRCKEWGLHTALDTSGFLGARASNRLLRDTDLVLLDVKSGDADTYRRVTGRALQPTLDFGERLSAQGIPIWLRYVLVPGLTDDEANVQKVADYAATLATVARIEVLPFHQMGRDKWTQLGQEYPLADVEPPSAALIDRVRDQFRGVGVDVY
jgi:pyruvate formate lyase activating enzyme